MSQEESLLCQAYEKQISDIKSEHKAKKQAFLEWLEKEAFDIQYWGGQHHKKIDRYNASERFVLAKRVLGKAKEML